ncbi:MULTISPECIES: hypothetical protein [unclassified Streptomyces]|uniref:hypothetical protein n=1 Tax=unclassified Streptomyces TaxID=2593676 RepID=UPI002E2B86C4|nr:hypothetical protein [Streptomyces sp. NBC_00223]
MPTAQPTPRSNYSGVWLSRYEYVSSGRDKDAMHTTARVLGALSGDEHNRDQDEEEPGSAPVPVVDSMGMGGGVVDRLRELGTPVLAYADAAKSRRRSRDGEFGFTNTRSAAYWNLRELLDPAFGAELALPRTTCWPAT